MPKKTKEQKELEETKNTSSKKASTTTKAKAKTTKTSSAKKATTSKKPTTKATSTKNASASTAKKTTTSSKKSATKKATTSSKESTTKKTATAKKSTAKATSAKKEVAKKTSTKKASTTKRATKASTTKKSTKKVVNKEEVLESAEYYDLPYRYNQTVVKILAQTPSTLFIYWEISDDDIENYKKQYGEDFFEITRPVLIVHNETLDYSFEVAINDFANSWYLKVNNSKCEYTIELGRRPIEHNENIKENYVYVATSNEIEAPNDHILLEKFPEIIKFRNVKNNSEYFKKLSELTIGNIRKIYNIYDLYKLIYEDENVDILSNPSSGGNPSSGTFSSTFK